jgi:hypothetical protein
VTRTAPTRLAPELLGVLADLGPVDPTAGDLSLELGLSLWVRRCGCSLPEACSGVDALRRAVLAATGLDPAGEPTPLLGRSPRTDLLTVASCLADLLRRVALAEGRPVHDVVAEVLAALPHTGALPESLGA